VTNEWSLETHSSRIRTGPVDIYNKISDINSLRLQFIVFCTNIHYIVMSDRSSASSSGESESEKEDGVVPSPKKFYTDMAAVLIPLATFAGGLTLATQFIIGCPGSRLEALLAMASQLFLAVPLVLLSIYLLLYRKPDNGTFDKSWQHGLVAGRFIIAGIMLGAAFLLLGAALFSAVIPTGRPAYQAWPACVWPGSIPPS
jgi:hypothetical protein